MSAIAPSSVVTRRAGDESAARVLYLTHRVPFPPDKGDRIRNYHLLRQMARRGRVWLACLADEPVTPEVSAALHQFAERVAIVPTGRRRWARALGSVLTGKSISEGAFSEPELTRVVRDWMGQTPFDAAVVSASSMASYLKVFSGSGTRAIVDLVDVDSQKWADFAAAARGPKRWLYRLEAARVRKLEQRLAGWADALAVVSPAEASVLDSFTAAGTATVAANGVDLDYFRPDSPTSENAGPGATGPVCVFVGAMDYLPNVDAAVWFARDVWPEIRKRFPTAVFQVVGRKPGPEVCQLAEIPGVFVVGQVPDVRPFVAAATVVVVPLRLARGIQNKVLEALAMGKPVIAAPPALAALKTEPGTDLLAATAPGQWVESVCRLFADPARCQTLGAAGREFVELNHHWEDCLEPLLAAIFTPAENRRPPRAASVFHP